ncbi:hypothetical protein J2X45_001735 [Caulobacter sp. BE264]|uniref:hypothetical protein n=1 Tax=Caulobacter sp. BE264 TaxID=2817724 RepID=UPI00285FC5FB|nr:hypothetical protein [Caulobacter sp. BE264]MDR7230644.1 hypothetical protein [Caulobacter sp. BE264]
MTGLAIRFNSTFTDTDLPKFKYDELLSDAAGSLMLLDVRNWSAGVPANAALLPNLAREQAALSGITGDTSAVFKKVGSLETSGQGLLERTTKGGLHVIVRQSSPIAIDNGYTIDVPTNVLAYMLANPTHNFYYSQWSKVTRVAIASNGGAPSTMSIENAANAGYVRFSHISGQQMPVGGNVIGNRESNSWNVTGDSFRNRAGKSSDTTPVAANYSISKSLATLGAGTRQNNYGPILGSLSSWVFYRAYIEDLTLSGRSYATVDALDYAMYQEAFGAAGRFYGDTYTAPSTIP